MAAPATEARPPVEGAPPAEGGVPPRAGLSFWWILTLLASVCGGMFFYGAGRYGWYYVQKDIPEREKRLLEGDWAEGRSLEGPDVVGNLHPLVDYPDGTDTKEETRKEEQETGRRTYRKKPGAVQVRVRELKKGEEELSAVMQGAGWGGQGVDGAGLSSLKTELERLHRGLLGLHEYRFELGETAFRQPEEKDHRPAAAPSAETPIDYYQSLRTPRGAPFGWDLETAREVMKVLAQRYREWEHRWKFLDISEHNAKVAGDTEVWARDTLMKPKLVEWQKTAEEQKQVQTTKIETQKAFADTEKQKRDQDKAKVQDEIRRVQEPQKAEIEAFKKRIEKIRVDIRKATGRNALFYEFDYRGLDGEVVYADVHRGFLVIDKGWAEGVNRGYPYLVFRYKGGHIVPEGDIEVKEVQEHVSHCRIRRMRDPKDPIQVGDRLENPLIVPDAAQPRVYMIFGRLKPVTGIPDELCRIWLRNHGNVVLEAPTKEPFWIPLLDVDYVIIGQITREEGGNPVEVKDVPALSEPQLTFIDTAKQLGIPFITTETFLKMMWGTHYTPRDKDLLQYLREDFGYQIQTTDEFFGLYRGM